MLSHCGYNTMSKKYSSASLLLFIYLFLCCFFSFCGLRDEHQKVADVFLSRKSRLNHHIAYIMQFDRNLALLDETCLKYSQLATMIQEFEVRLTCFFTCTNAWLCHGDYSKIFSGTPPMFTHRVEWKNSLLSQPWC